MINLNKLSSVYKTTLEMLYDRSYDVSDYYDGKEIIRFCEPDDNDEHLSQNDKLLLAYNKNNNKVIIQDNNDKKTSILFYQSKIGINEVKKIIEYIDEDEIKHIILIITDPLTTYAVKEMKNNKNNTELEIFYENEMIYNITKHVLVPKHELLDEKHTKLMLNKFGRKIPIIKVTDRISRYYNGKLNQVFKIYRDNEIFFRLVA